MINRLQPDARHWPVNRTIIFSILNGKFITKCLKLLLNFD